MNFLFQLNIILIFLIIGSYAEDKPKRTPKRREKDDEMFSQTGRVESIAPSPRCCEDIDCLNNDKGKYAILLTIRTESYIPLLRKSVCSAHYTNPNIKIIVATVIGDLSNKAIESIKSIGNFIEIIYWKELTYINKKCERFALNWVKIRVWEMINYDAILMIDADTTVLGDISHLFKLPTAFASALGIYYLLIY